MHKTLIVVFGTAILLAVIIIGTLILGSINRAAERERFDRSWQNCTLLFEEFDDIVDCHIRNVSE